MEGKRSSTKPCNLLKKIREFTRSLVEDLCNGRSPVVALGRYWNYCSYPTGNCCCSSDLHKGIEILSLQKECYAQRLNVLLRVLLIVQQLLQEKKHGSKRDIYYTHPSIFSDQAVVDRAINDICILLQCSRHNLNVVSVGNGLVMGWLRFSEGGRIFDCLRRPSIAHPIPVSVEEVKDIICVARYILVVEKEAVFQRLANDQFCNTNRCIIITGRGYPDVPTRRFLRLLVEKLQLPVYCLVDCDPYGFDILTTYRFGSMQMAYDAKFLRVPEIRWLGAFPSDSERHQLPGQCLLPLTSEDKRKVEAMLLRCYLQQAPRWRSELETMLQSGVKFEIEALSVTSISFLSDEYIPSKIQEMATIKSPNNVKCWIRRQNCPCGELKCYIRFEEEEEDLELRKSESAAASPLVPVGTDVEISPPYVGQTFYTDDDAFEYYSNFAKKNGFAIRRESSKSSQRLGTYRRELVCYRAGVARHRKSAEPERQKNRKSTLCGCEAKMTIVKEFFGTVPQWTIKRFSNIHNHELLTDDQLRLLPAYRKIPAADRERILLLRKAGYSTSHIMKMLGSDRGGEQGQLPFIDRDVRNFIQSSSKKIDRESEVSDLLNLCENEKQRNADFIYSFTADGNDKLENLAWTYGESFRAYEVFGDLVVFDASYREISYDRLLGVWFGVDNHGKIIFFGAVLLQDETSRSFSWALQSFLQFMKGRCPQTILTDVDLGLRDAIISEWPNAKHAFCMWHVFSKLSSWFYPALGSRYEEFKFEFTRLYNLDTVKDFECQWNHMIACFGLNSNKHIVLLFSHRASWALSFIRGYFHAGMTTTKFSKSIDAFLKEILSAQTCSESFFEKVAGIVSSKNIVGEEEMEDVHSRTSIPIEEHASSLLTPYAFNMLQQEIVLSMHCAAFEMPNDLYLVRHHKQVDGGHLVSWTSKDERIHCSCKEFEFSGIICRHVLRVLALKNYFHIPEKYLPIRWRRESSIGSKSTQNNSNEWCQAFHSLTTTLFAESSITKERIDYVQTELARVLNHVRNMQGCDEIPLNLESTPPMDARMEDAANGGEFNSIGDLCQSNTGGTTKKRKM